MDREYREIIVFLIFLAFISLALAILSLGILSKNILEIVISVIFASGIFAFMYVMIYSIFADIYDEIDELKRKLKEKHKK
jgi:sensor histidine kinase YesM